MDGGGGSGGLVQRGTIHTAQDFLPAAASPLLSIMKADQNIIRLETSVCGVQNVITLQSLGENGKKQQYILKCDVIA